MVSIQTMLEALNIQVKVKARDADKWLRDVTVGHGLTWQDF